MYQNIIFQQYLGKSDKIFLNCNTELVKAEEHNRKLKAQTDRKQFNNNNAKLNNRHKQTDRTTKLLIVILILFLVAEFPLVNICPLTILYCRYIHHSVGFVEESLLPPIERCF